MADRRGPGGVVTLTWSGRSDAGKVRTLNEDAFFARPGLFLVADGMGGHAAGEVASAAAIAVLEELPSSPLPTLSSLDDAIRSANERIRELAARTPATQGMGTTLVGLALVDNGGQTYWASFNLGDSRLYQRVNGQTKQLTTDHSYVAELVAAGELSREQARSHPQRNVVTRALGVDPVIEPDYVVFPPSPGQRFLLCSDGLTADLTDESIGRSLLESESAEVAVGQLVDAALAGAARDNITVVVIDVERVDIEASDALDERLDDTLDHELLQPGQPFPAPDVDGLIADVPFDRADDPGTRADDAGPELIEKVPE